MSNFITYGSNILLFNAYPTLNTGLVSYFKLDGDGIDSLGTNTGIYSGVTFSLANGKINQGAGFTGSTTSIITSAGTTSSFSYIQNTATFSISLWAKTVNFANTTEFMGNNAGTTAQKGFYIENAGGAFNMQVTNGVGSPSTSPVNNKFNGVITDNNFHHYVLTCSSGSNQVILYKDGITQGVQKLNTAGSSVLSTGNSFAPLNIGSIAGFGSNQWNGAMDELGFWNRALTSGEVQILYNNNIGLQYKFPQTDNQILQF